LSCSASTRDVPAVAAPPAAAPARPRRPLWRSPVLGVFVYAAIGIGLIAVIVAGIFYMQRGARVGLAGNFLKVRTAPLDENSSVAVVDFRVSNPANVRFMVRTVTLVLEDADGNRYDGRTVAEVDAKRLFEAIPLLGQKFNDTLLGNESVSPHAAMDRMIASRFDAPESRIEKRRRFVLKIEDVDGPITEINER
jgi:hypothetical protein